MVLASIVFVVVYALIVSEKVHRTIAALLGGMLMIIFAVLDQTQAIRAVDFSTIGLLVGMMIMVDITKNTGLFEYLAVKGAKIAKGRPMQIMVALAILTAVASAFLDNVTTVLLIVPVTFSLTRQLDVNPFPFLMAEIFASNIGGTATLIGDPPNIMIGSKVGLTFTDFLFNLAPIVIIILIVTIGIFYLVFKNEVVVAKENQAKILNMDEKAEIRDYRLLRKSLIVLGAVILGFMLHGLLNLEPATIALTGAAVLLLISGYKPEEVLKGVEWSVIFFFAGLFILVGALDATGVIKFLASEALKVTGGNLLLTTMLVLWMSAIASAFIDNIPFVATMIPLIKSLGALSGMNIGPLWWALSLGACLGGNGTLIGASANVVVAGIAGEHGHPISFKKYFRYGFLIMLVSIVISTIYLYVFYL